MRHGSRSASNWTARDGFAPAGTGAGLEHYMKTHTSISASDTAGRAARRARNREAIRQRELVSLPETIRILKADMDVALSKGNTTLAKAKATAIENCRARLARAHQEPS